MKLALRNYNGIKVAIVFFAVEFVACGNGQTDRLDLPYFNVDSITVTKRDDGQSWDYAYRFTIKETEFFNSVYRDYINKGKHIENYYAKLPLHKYDFKTYRYDGKNDTFDLYQDYVQLSGFGVIHLPNSLEPLLDNAFKEDSLQKSASLEQR